IINNNNTIPILDNFLFSLDNNELSISASDLETTISSKIEVESSETGSICIRANLLLDTLQTFAEQPLTITTTDSNTVEISSSHGKYALAYDNSNDFPTQIELLDSNATVMHADILATAINKPLFATGNDDLRPVMSGVLFQFKND